MIARVWTARASKTSAATYTEHFFTSVLPSVRRIHGYLGASVLQQETDDDVEIVVVTRWTSLDAVRDFAGEPIDRAVVTGEARDLLASFDDRVRHYHVALEDQAS
jgi:heme-degrading monooxygenase HmoA